MDYNKLCLGCFRENKSGSEDCPFCGFNEKGYNRNAADKKYLPAGIILQGKYLIGRQLGEGGFGIIYIAFQMNLNRVVVIKEFFPPDIIIRNCQPGSAGRDLSIIVTRPESREYFNKLLLSFETEGQLLASISLPGVVGIYDSFRENSTAYMVIEYINGQNLKEYQKTKGGKLEETELLKLLEPAVRTIAKIHETGIIHRDLSPDNMMRNTEGKIVLIDFGAAIFRDEIFQSERKRFTAVLKKGYAPVELYDTHEEQGPWTDVYEFCAAMYRLLTGNTPEEVSIRMSRENLEADTRKVLLEAGVSWKTADAVAKGMCLQPDQRIRNMHELWKALYE